MLLALTGFMGSGKTSVGRLVADALGCPFLDLDAIIEKASERSIPEIFAADGEEGFRKIEYNMLHEVAEFEDVIISCGGGTPCFFDNMDYLNQQGDVVYLKSSPETLYKHLLMAKVERPLLKGKSAEELIAYITEHLAEREPFYQKAHHILDVNVLDDNDKILSSVAALRQLLAI